ncbi:hypothetical protein [Pseudomonas sp. RIT-PI-AD]|uniref:hypothetical protein n=1 Tax=Pseudomonas sp. RIT-PI-AD TaxID=3035294 RepID=UPI0021DB244E|nr:hypothetical protein [Pseudomonas sp. RIT-PI-AD]
MAADEVLVLHRRMRSPRLESLHCRAFELRLAEDGRHLILSRYTELYCEDRSAWESIGHHRVPLVSLVRWMIGHGAQEDA